MHELAIGPDSITDVSKAELLRSVLLRPHLGNIQTGFTGLSNANIPSEERPRPQTLSNRISALHHFLLRLVRVGNSTLGGAMQPTPQNLTTP